MLTWHWADRIDIERPNAGYAGYAGYAAHPAQFLELHLYQYQYDNIEHSIVFDCLPFS